MSALVRSVERPVAATSWPMVAASPEVEMLGFVLPSLKSPHSGCPTLAQPSGLLARARISVQPMRVSGQPSASAIGRGIAMTSGVVVTDPRLASSSSCVG